MALTDYFPMDNKIDLKNYRVFVHDLLLLIINQMIL